MLVDKDGSTSSKTNFLFDKYYPDIQYYFHFVRVNFRCLEALLRPDKKFVRTEHFFANISRILSAFFSEYVKIQSCSLTIISDIFYEHILKLLRHTFKIIVFSH